MPSITVDIPANKVALVKSAVLHHTGSEDMTDQEVVDYIKSKWISQLIRMSKKQQDAERDSAAVYDDLELS